LGKTFIDRGLNEDRTAGGPLHKIRLGLLADLARQESVAVLDEIASLPVAALPRHDVVDLAPCGAGAAEPAMSSLQAHLQFGAALLTLLRLSWLWVAHLLRPSFSKNFALHWFADFHCAVFTLIHPLRKPDR
jgi:hypothetical protein